MSLERDDLIKQDMPLPAQIGMDSPACHWHRIAGRMTVNPLAHAPAGAGDFFANIFRVVGFVELKALYGEFIVASDPGINGPKNCYFTFDDGAAAVSLTSGTPHTGGVDCSSALVNTTILKNSALADVAVYLEGSQCRYTELTTGGAARPFWGGNLQAKGTVNTNYIRFNYTVANGAMTFSIYWVAVWTCRYPGSYIVAV